MKLTVFLISIVFLFSSCSRHERRDNRNHRAVVNLAQATQDHINLKNDHKRIKELFDWLENQMSLKEQKIKSHEKLIDRYVKMKEKLLTTQNITVSNGLKQSMSNIQDDLAKDHSQIMYDHNKLMEIIIQLVSYKRELTQTLKVK